MLSANKNKPYLPMQLSLPILLGGSSADSLETALAKFNTDPTQPKRNAVVGALLAASERNCDIYVENLRGNQATWRTTFSLSTVVLGAAGSIVTDADSARTLSALSGAAGGASGKMDENILAGRGAEVILTGIRAAREPYRLQLIDSMKKQPYPDWPLEVALADVMRYHGRCNVISGLSAIQTATEKDIESAVAKK
ncbi:hypothetical protein ASD79_14135 [Caulobacter sp. Root655]|uniref:hypothetical protein n=1 Tax=Caulobacter sp. Root655 TaxID=1736578 RepID=UPI0006F2717C|nr:hypothetical protein [Caulobacter sp. Root655]KRA58447.1 hypothetical protein ASD79_14135 [Caulobacter sp. Root655]